MTEQLPSSLFALLGQLNSEGTTGFEKYKRVRRYIQFKARERGVPVCGTFELTPQCNLSCRMCYVRLDKQQMKGRELLPASVWNSMIDQAVDAGMMYASVTGGECLTYEGFREVYLHLLSKGVEVDLLTNGILLTEETVSFLDAHPPASIQITLYGPDEDEYEQVTGHRAFQKVMDGMARLKAHKLPFTVAVTPNHYMTKPRELVRLLYELDVPFAINSGLKTPREETGRRLWEASLDTYIDLYDEDRRLGGGRPLRTIPDEDLPDPGGPGDAGTKAERGVQCAAGRSSFCVTWNGRIRPCNSFPGIEEDVLKLGFKEAWESINRQVREVPCPVECRGCRYEKVCKHCIIEHLERGRPGHADPAVCAHVRRLVKEGFVHL